MDEIRMLHLLANNPRITITDLADLLGESEGDVENKKTELEKNKVICGYHTVINWDKTNEERVDSMILVSAKPERNSGYDRIAERIARFPEVSSLYLMSGTSEFVVNVNARTMREVSDFVGQKLAPIEGVTSTVTCFVLKKYKVDGINMEIESEIIDERAIISA